MGALQRTMEHKLRGDLRGEKGKNAWLQLAKEQTERIERKLHEEAKPLGDTVSGGNGGWLNHAMKGGGYDIFAELDDEKDEAEEKEQALDEAVREYNGAVSSQTRQVGLAEDRNEEDGLGAERNQDVDETTSGSPAGSPAPSYLQAG